LIVFFKADTARGIDVEELVRFWEKGNDVVGPAAVIATAGVGDEDHLGLAVAIEILASVILVKNHVKPGCAEHDPSCSVVDGSSALVAVALAVPGRAERNLVTVPQFLYVRSVLGFGQVSGMTGNLAQHVLRAERRRNGGNKNHCEENSVH
jgi:hypothetical protein